MKLVIIFLNRVEYLEELLTAFLEIGVSGATVLNSVGMGRIVSENIPIFAGLQDTFVGSSPENKTILVVVKEEIVDKMGDVVQDVCGNFENPGSGIMVSVPLDKVLGLKPVLD